MVSIKNNVVSKDKNTKFQKSARIKKLKKKEHKYDIKALEQSVIKEVKNENTGSKKAQINKSKFVMPSAAVTDEIVNSSLNVLLNVLVPQENNKNAIFDDEKQIFLEIHCIKIQNTRGNVKFVLPHSTVASTGEVCLITPDIKKGRKHDHEPTVEKWEDMLRNAGVTEVKTILPVRQLRVEYDQFELKRRLLTQHDFVLVDTRVLSHVSHLLGKIFFKKHNMLIPVRINEQYLKNSINRGLHTTMLRLSEGETSVITVGHTGMPQEKIKENILAIVKQLEDRFPGGEGNIRSLSVMMPKSYPLPIYLTLRPSSTIKPPKLTQKRPKNYTVLEDELSTIPGRSVRVAPDGTVHLKKIKKAPESDIEEDETEADDMEEEDQKSEESE